MTKKRKIRNYLGRNFQNKNLGDKISVEKRSALMSKIRSKETRLELDFIKLLKKSTKFSFVTHQRDIKGNPDIVFRSKKICVFIDSDFWHCWQFPRWKKTFKMIFGEIKSETIEKETEARLLF